MDYQEFLKNPTPKKQWCGPSTRRQSKDRAMSENWRPFVKGLGNSSVNKALTILDSFFNYLVQCNYLKGDPLAVDRRRKKRNKSKPNIIDRYLELEEINAVLEAANHCMENFLQREENWFFRVIGKGKKLREIPMPDELFKALSAFRVSAGLPSPLPKFKEKTPLIPMKNLLQYCTN